MEQPLKDTPKEDALTYECEVNITLNATSNEFLLKKIETSKFPLVRVEKFDVHGYFLKQNSFKVTRRVQSTVDEIFLFTHYNTYANEKIDIQYLGPRKGYGVIAIDNIPENEVVCLFMGIIVFKKPRGRSDRVMEVNDDWNTYWIDSKKDEESYSAFLNDNHENPNLEVRYIKPSMSKFKYPFFVSSRKILKNEELTYRYPGLDEDYWWRNTLWKYNSLKYNLRKPKLLSNGKNLQKILEYHVDNNITNDNSSFEIVDCKEKGKGVIAMRHFPKESFLMYYSGEEVEDEKVENDAYVYEIHINNKRKCIDAFHSKCYSRYLNDNNESPNVYVKPIAHPGNGKIYIVFVAKCDINPGDQLEYDYGGGSRNYDWRKKPKLSQDSKISCESNDSKIEGNVNKDENSLLIEENSSVSSFENNNNEYEKAFEVETIPSTKSCDISDDDNDDDIVESNSSTDKDGHVKTIPTSNNDNNNNDEYDERDNDDNNNNDEYDERNNDNEVHDSSMGSTTPPILCNNNIDINNSSNASGDEEIWNILPINIQKEKRGKINNDFKNLEPPYIFDSKYLKDENVQEKLNSSHVCPFSPDFDRNSEIEILEKFKKILLDLFKLQKSNLVDQSLGFTEFLKPKFYTGVKDHPWKAFALENVSVFNFWKDCRSLCEKFLKIKSFININSGNQVDWFPRCDDNFTLCPEFIDYLDSLETILKNRYVNLKIPYLTYERKVKYLFDIIIKLTKDSESDFNYENQKCTNTDGNKKKIPQNVLRSFNQESFSQGSRKNKNMTPKHSMRDLEDFNKSFLEVEIWFEDMEKVINMNSCSLDIVDTQNKLKQHAELEAAVISYQDSVDAFKLFGRLLNTQKTCEQLNIVSKIDILEKRYNALRKTVNDKKATLESSLKALQMLSKLEDEHIWIQKKEPFCRISSYGISLKRVSSLIAKHKALIDDLNVHEPIIKEFSTSLETLDAPSAIREIIKAKVDLINEKWLLLKSNASQRSIRLHYSRLVHHFYSVVSVFEKWLNSNENADYLNGFVVNLQDIETYQQKIKLMDSLVSKISSALKKNKDLEKLEICQGFIISKKEDIENSHHHPLVFEKDNDVDLIKRKHEQIKIRFGRLMREKTGTH